MSSSLYWTWPSIGCSTMCGRLTPATLEPSAGSWLSWDHSSAPPAPGLYWTIVSIAGQRFLISSCWCRAAMSDSPPAGNACQYWMFLSGHTWPCASGAASRASRANSFFIATILRSRSWSGIRAIMKQRKRRRVAARAALRRAAILGEDVVQDVGLELRVVRGPRRQRRDPPAARHPREVAADLVADDLDHLAHDGDADVARVPPPHLDLLLGVAVDGLVEAEEIEVRGVVLDVDDLEQAAGVARVV